MLRLRQRLSARWAALKISADNLLSNGPFTMFISFVCVMIGLGSLMYLIALFVVFAHGR